MNRGDGLVSIRQDGLAVTLQDGLVATLQGSLVLNHQDRLVLIRLGGVVLTGRSSLVLNRQVFFRLKCTIFSVDSSLTSVRNGAKVPSTDILGQYFYMSTQCRVLFFFC